LTASDDGRALLAAAESGWDRPVPHCPAWNAAALVRHTGSIFGWMASVVSSKELIAPRAIDPVPEDLAALASWYLGALDRVVDVLGAAEPGSETWTFSPTGDRRVQWWRRRLAVEVAVHRYDAEYAAFVAGGPAPASLDADVAAAGIEEFVVEFLPGLLDGAGIEGLAGTLHLHATDRPLEWWINLDVPGAARPEHAKADTAVRATRSDLLLWLTNRALLDSFDVIGNLGIADRWRQLER
jgi:mycothiol maleylpyruvate isomerase-like protein